MRPFDKAVNMFGVFAPFLAILAVAPFAWENHWLGWSDIVVFVVLYAIVGGVFLFLLDKIIKAGPPEPPSVDDIESLPDTWSEAFQHRSRVSGGGR